MIRNIYLFKRGIIAKEKWTLFKPNESHLVIAKVSTIVENNIVIKNKVVYTSHKKPFVEEQKWWMTTLIWKVDKINMEQEVKNGRHSKTKR